jgi:hypothetical protein
LREYIEPEAPATRAQIDKELDRLDTMLGAFNQNEYQCRWRLVELMMGGTGPQQHPANRGCYSCKWLCCTTLDITTHPTLRCTNKKGDPDWANWSTGGPGRLRLDDPILPVEGLMCDYIASLPWWAWYRRSQAPQRFKMKMPCWEGGLPKQVHDNAIIGGPNIETDWACPHCGYKIEGRLPPHATYGIVRCLGCGRRDKAGRSTFTVRIYFKVDAENNQLVPLGWRNHHGNYHHSKGANELRRM